MRFPCKSCGHEIINAQLDVLVQQNRDEFFSQECPKCGNIHSYSWLRIKHIPEET